jgi:predicted ArsR family transcriptional regulator
MHSTKTEILALLKRNDGATVDELSSSLGLASMTVRQHLTALERDDLLRGQEVRRPMGRPHYRYQLTEEGHRRVSEGYDRLVSLLVDTAGYLNGGSPESERRRLFRDAAQRLAQRYRPELSGLSGAELVERVVAILQSHGGFAEYHRRDEVYELRDFNCVFRSDVTGDGPCDWHEPLLAALLEAPVLAASAPGDGCAACCSYTVPVQCLSHASSRGSL